MSRSSQPKQLLRLTSAETMLQLTALRSAGSDRFGPPIIVGNALHATEIQEQLEAVNATPSLLILEPVARNTAPAIALAALAALENDDDATLLVMPSDQVIEDVDAFRAAIEAALPVVEQGWLVTFGIKPTGPETGYGYILMGDPIESGVREVKQFVEKPDRKTAEQFLATGNYAWNGGIFLFRADSFLGALANQAPDIAIAVRKSIDAAGRRGRLLYPEPKSFAQSPSQSIDYAVMEKSESVAVIPVNMGWSDIGSWDALYELAAKDDFANAHHGEVISLDSNGCLIRSNGPVVAAVGVKDLIVIATGDAVLILPRGSSQDVKQIIDELKRREHRTL